jgi:hypothetical protein
MAKHPGGRPPLYKSPAEMQRKIEKYFKECDDEKKKVTVSGMAYHLGFESRQSMYDYCKHEEFSYIIKRARLRLESYYEEKVQGNCPTGPIFVLKNMGWSDKQEIEHSGTTTSVNIDYNNLPENEAKKKYAELLKKAKE